MATHAQIDALQAALEEGRPADVRREVEALIGAMDGATAGAPDDLRVRAEILLLTALSQTGEPDPDRARRLVDALTANGSAHFPRAVFALGQALFASQRNQDAEPWLTEAASLGRGAGDLEASWRALALLGVIRAQRQDMEAAEHLLRDASAGLESLGVHREAALRWTGLATVLLWQGRRDEVVEVFDAAERCAARHPEILADVLRNRSRLARQLNDTDGARALLERALAALGAARSIVTARIYNDLGDLARAEGKVDEARRHLLASLAARKGREEGITRLNLALLELEAGDRAAAREAVAPVLEGEGYVWYRVFAHGVGAAAADDVDGLDPHLDALEAAVEQIPYADRDMLDLLGRAARAWADRDPHRAARLAVLRHTQASALHLEEDAAEAQLRALREGGADVPLGPLSVRDEVRSGGMGQVWRARVRGTELDVAVKVLAPERAHEPHVRAALTRELHAVASLDHPHIVPLVDHGLVPAAVDAMTSGRLTRGIPWLATRWAPHGTLAEWHGQRPFRQIRDALLQLLDALAAAHVDGLLHLDVKPANVLVAHEEPLTVWLADFGVARALSADADQPVAGTPAFMAPEQCQGRVRHYGPWTDLYAVGGTAVALVQGHPPFTGSSAELLQQQVTRPAPPIRPLVPVPPGFEAWCARLLAKAPEDRFRCAADAAAALSALPEVADGPIGAMQAPAPVHASSSTFLLDAIGSAAEAPEAVDRPAPVAGIPEAPPAVRVRTTVPELASAASRLLPLRRVPLVGRGAERQALWAALREADRAARVVQLGSASPGGRTHLMRWLADAAGRTGAARVLWVTDTEGDPWRATLQGLLHAQGLGLEALERSLPRLLDLHVGEDALGETERGLLIQALVEEEGPGRAALDAVPLALRLVEAMARERPVLVCLASADPSGATFVTRLLEAMADRRVLVVAARDLTCPAHVEPRVERIDLGPLEPGATVELVDALLPLEPSLRDALAAASGGDPAAVVWTVRRWLVDRSLQRSRLGLTLARDQVMPRSAAEAARGVLEPVLAAAGDRRRRVELAAVYGARISREAWTRLCEIDGIPFDPALPEAMVARGLLVDDGSGWRFADRVVRQLMLDGMDPADRAARHRSAAEAVTDDRRRAVHFIGARSPAEALAPLRRAMLLASRRATRVARELQALWQQAREASGLPDDAPEVVRGAVVGWLATPAWASELPAIDLRIEQARRLGDRDSEALGWLARASVHRDRQAVTGVDPFVQAAASAVAAGPVDLEIRRLALQVLGRARLAAGDRDGAMQPLMDAVQLGDGTARTWLAGALYQAGEIAQAARWIEVTRPALEISAYPETIQRLMFAATLAEATGHPQIAEQRLREGVALGVAVSDSTAYLACANRLLFALRRGDRQTVRAMLPGLAVLPDEPLGQAARALFHDPSGSPLERLARLREVVLGTAWGIDRAEVAEMIALAAAWPAWADQRDALVALAEEVRGG